MTRLRFLAAIALLIPCHAAEFEDHLLPRVQVEGRPSVQYSLVERMSHYRVPAVSVAVIKAGKIDWAQAWGVVEAGGRKANPDTVFQAASISKPVAAMAALHMSQFGNFGLDDDVNSKLKSWQVPKFDFNGKVTLRELLSHSAGLTVHGFPGYAADAEIPAVPQILDGAKPANTAAVRVDVEPGSVWRYSGGGYTVMQLLLTDVSKLAFPELMRKMVIDRIGMRRSTYAQPLPEDWHENAARGHRGNGRIVEGRWHVYPEMAAAGLWTTPSDLARFAIELWKSARGESNKVIEKATAVEMLKVQKGEYGLGVGVSGEGAAQRFEHGGSNAGFKCRMVMFRESGDGFVVMTNGDNGSALGDEMLRGAAALYGWPAFKPETKKAFPLDAEVLKAYAGTFASGGLQLRLVVEGDRFLAYLPDGRPAVELIPESADVFFPLAEGLPPLKFIRGPKGELNEIDIGGRRRQRVAAK